MKALRKTTVYTALALLLTAIVIIMTVTMGIYAKYLHDNAYDDNQIKAENFYFTVDLLGDTNEQDSLEKNIYIYGGEAQDVSFTVQNYFDSLRSNAFDVDYSVSLTKPEGVEATLEKLGGNATESERLSGGASQEYVLHLPKLGVSFEDKTFSVTVRSSAPYAKTMKLNFILHMYQYEVEYYVLDAVDEPFAELVVMANTEIGLGKIKVDWSTINADANILQVDCTSGNVLDDLELTTNDPENGYLSSLTVTKGMKAMESISIYFFKANAQADYSTGADTHQGVVKNEQGEYVITLQEKGQN